MRPGMHTPRESGARLALDAFFESAQRSLWKRLVILVVGLWGISLVTAAIQLACLTVLSRALTPDAPSSLPTLFIWFLGSLGGLAMLLVPALFLLTGTVVQRSLRFVFLWSLPLAFVPLVASHFGGILWWFAMIGVMVWALKRHPILVVLEDPWSDVP